MSSISPDCNAHIILRFQGIHKAVSFIVLFFSLTKPVWSFLSPTLTAAMEVQKFIHGSIEVKIKKLVMLKYLGKPYFCNLI